MRRLTLLMVCGLFSIMGMAQVHFSFDKGVFTIAQFTDIHWAPESDNCPKTEETIRLVLQSEQPDLAILSGDVVTDDPGLEGWKSIIAIFNDAKMPFIVTMGNHDAEHLSKQEIYDLLLQSPYYVGKKGPQEIDGTGNFVLPIYNSTQRNSVEALVYCIDSNDYPHNKRYGDYDKIHFNQVEWYRKESAHFSKLNGGNPIPALAFFHIPLPEYKEIGENNAMLGSRNERITASEINSGIFSSFVDMGDVMGVFTGHDHDNDFIGIKNGIALAYGRVTGEDAYGKLTRGARIIKLYENEFKFDSWVTTPEGRETIFYYPSGLTSQEEESMIYLPSVKCDFDEHGVAYKYYEGECKSVAGITGLKKVHSGELNNFVITKAPQEDHFAYLFTSFIYIKERGVYRFYTYSDDGSKLYIDGQLVVNNDGGHSARKVAGKVALEAGFHEIKVFYFEDYMGQSLEVGYSSKDVKEGQIQDDMLFLPISK